MQGQVMARRGGRPRKAGPREKNGRPKRMTVVAREQDVRALSTESRCRLMGWPATPSNLTEARRPVYGTTEGRLYMAKAISAREHDAIRLYAGLRADYMRAISMPRETPQGADLEGIRGPSTYQPSEAKVKRLTAEYMDTQAILGGVSAHAVSLLTSVIADDLGVWQFTAASLAELRRAAAALADHFHLDAEG